MGRVGGDEFVVMLLCEEERGSDLIRQMQQANQLLNQQSDKEYFVEISMGCKMVTCKDDLALSDILVSADRAMYDAKKNRRASVQKRNSRRIP